MTSRCAIYTRKSSEEGLEQGFNSLHAQREACAAYVLSQAGEGWQALPTPYDDGGFSGGNMERPGLKALLADIDRGLVDIVVVYKVDRLTRSLSDFSKIVERFDAKGVSFVSVTQAFNTTSSMGRLTLNMLLSFAQFEREVTGERIRDKIAASKAKGMWMGGRPPIGYDGVDRKLVINEPEAAVVRDLFDRYLALGSVKALATDLAARGVRSKSWVSKKGETLGGGTWTRGALYLLLANPVYRGAIRHHDKIYPGCHPAIIDEATWERVQAQLAGNCPDHPTTPRLSAGALLAGLVFDDRGSPMAPIHTAKSGQRYRYYVSSALRAGGPAGSLPRIAMGVLDTFVIDRLAPTLSVAWRPDAPPDQRVADALLRVTVSAERISAVLRPEALIAHPKVEGGDVRRLEEAVEAAFAIRLKHRHGAVIIAADGSAPSAPVIDRALVRAVSLAKRWAHLLESGEVRSVAGLAERHGLCNHYAGRLLPLAWLAPDLVRQILEGTQPRAITLAALTKAPLPADWDDQRRLFASLA